jgi:hypothetical protein
MITMPLGEGDELAAAVLQVGDGGSGDFQA